MRKEREHIKNAQDGAGTKKDKTNSNLLFARETDSASATCSCVRFASSLLALSFSPISINPPRMRCFCMAQICFCYRYHGITCAFCLSKFLYIRGKEASKVFYIGEDRELFIKCQNVYCLARYMAQMSSVTMPIKMIIFLSVRCLYSLTLCTASS